MYDSLHLILYTHAQTIKILQIIITGRFKILYLEARGKYNTDSVHIFTNSGMNLRTY